MDKSQLPKKILIVDRDKSSVSSVVTALEKQGTSADLASDRQSALYLFNHNSYPVMIVEMEFEDLPGLVFLQNCRTHEFASKRAVSCVIAVGNRMEQKKENLALAQELGGVDFIEKPFVQHKLFALLQKAFARFLSETKFEELENEIKRIAGVESELPNVINRLKQSVTEFGPRALDLMRLAYERTGKWEEALNPVEALLSKEPNNIRHLNNKGRILLHLNRPKDALEVMEIADQQAPKNVERINNMAMAYLETQQVDKSLDKMREVLSYEEKGSEKKFEFFSKLYDYGFDEAAHTLCKETTSPSEIVRHYNNLGVALARSQNFEQAILQYNRCLQFYPKYKDNYRICYNLALAHVSFKTKEHDEKALKVLEQCLGYNKSYEKAQSILESVKKRLKQYELKKDPAAS